MSTNSVRTSDQPADLFTLGQVVATRSVAAAMQHSPAFAAFVSNSLRRHHEGDWGALAISDATANDLALVHRDRILSAYPAPADILPKSALDTRIWIITEGDRSATTVLFPSDY